MPEGPELHFASRFINSICKDLVFTGKVTKSKTSRSPPVSWDVDRYSISSFSRGKELKLTLAQLPEDKDFIPKTKEIVVQFGLSGRFRLDPVAEIHKHAQLNFFTKDDAMVLSFVDPRRFGSWNPDGEWGRDRGPCVLTEYQDFRDKVEKNLPSATFNKPICEAIIDQKFFNGIGNYLRAEILFRAGVPPFEKARDVLEKVFGDAGAKSADPDLLELCHTIPNEVIHLTEYSGYDAETDSEANSAFTAWLRCYYKPEMRNMVDHNKRTIWFHGPAGPMAPKDAQERHVSAKKGGAKMASKAAFESNVKKPGTSSEHKVGTSDVNNDTEKPKEQRSAPKRSAAKSQANEESIPSEKTARLETKRKAGARANDSGSTVGETSAKSSKNKKLAPQARGTKRGNTQEKPANERKLRQSARTRAKTSV